MLKIAAKVFLIVVIISATLSLLLNNAFTLNNQMQNHSVSINKSQLDLKTNNRQFPVIFGKKGLTSPSKNSLNENSNQNTNNNLQISLNASLIVLYWNSTLTRVAINTINLTSSKIVLPTIVNIFCKNLSNDLLSEITFSYNQNGTWYMLFSLSFMFYTNPGIYNLTITSTTIPNNNSISTTLLLEKKSLSFDLPEISIKSPYTTDIYSVNYLPIFGTATEVNSFRFLKIFIDNTQILIANFQTINYINSTDFFLTKNLIEFHWIASGFAYQIPKSPNPYLTISLSIYLENVEGLSIYVNKSITLDNIGPSITLISPAENSIISGFKFNFSVKIDDNSGQAIEIQDFILPQSYSTEQTYIKNYTLPYIFNSSLDLNLQNLPVNSLTVYLEIIAFDAHHMQSINNFTFILKGAGLTQTVSSHFLPNNSQVNPNSEANFVFAIILISPLILVFGRVMGRFFKKKR